MTSVRLAAARVLIRVAARQATLAAELERAREPFHDRRDRGLLVELAAGTLRWQRELDALISAASARPARNIDERALTVLRLGAYQLRHLERVPAHAIVHESVETVRALGAPRAAGFVNAVLRRMTRRDMAKTLPGRPKPDAPDADWLPYLSVTLSHPEWLIGRWIDRYGPEATERWCRFNNASPETVVRPIGMTADDLIGRLRAEGLAVTPTRFVSDAVRLAPGALGRIPPALAAHVLVQDEGAQVVARAVGARPGERILDVCAAPGGKTMVLARDLGDTDEPRPRLVAADQRPARVALLARTIEGAGLDVPVVALDARRPLPFGAVFDAVLVDAPCSGLGTLRRDPDLKWTCAAADLARLSADQLRMLTASAEAVRPGGRLIYATCSSEPEENAQVVEAFLQADGRFTLDPLGPPRAPGQLVNTQGFLMTLPFRDDLDAFFAAVLVRRQGT